MVCPSNFKDLPCKMLLRGMFRYSFMRIFFFFYLGRFFLISLLITMHNSLNVIILSM